MRTAILISGRGSNMAALLDAAAGPGFPAEIVLVVADRAKATPGLARAEARGIPTRSIIARDFPDKPAFEAALDAALTEARIELVCLAGFMRLLSEAFVGRWRDRIINIHPSLLPSFPGLHTHERALEAGVKLHGCTVHFVRPAMDAGPIIVQAAVPVLDDDDADRLAARVLAAEHRIYPLALGLVASGAVRVVDERVVGAPAPEETALLIAPAPPPSLRPGAAPDSKAEPT